MEISLLRHSISAANNLNQISGRGNNSPLAPEGVDYAKKVGQNFNTDQFDLVYASPMIRAKQTAELVTKNREDIIVDPRLSEMDFGSWDGLDPDPLRRDFPDAFDYTGMLNANFANYADESESYDDLIQRVDGLIQELKTGHPAENILIVSHGMTIRAIFADIFGNDIFEYAASENIALNQVHLDENDNFRPRLNVYNRPIVER